MTTPTKRRIIGGVTATLLTIGLFLGYRSYAEQSRFEEAKRLAAQLQGAPRGKNDELQKKFRAQLALLTRDQRMEVFESGFDARLDEYFKKSPEERKAWMDSMAKRARSMAFRRPPGKSKAGTAKGNAKAGTAKGKGQWGGRGGPGGRGGMGGGRGGMGGGPGGGRGRSTPEQRAQARRERLDKTSPESRRQRGEFFAAMKGRRGGGRFGGGRR